MDDPLEQTIKTKPTGAIVAFAFFFCLLLTFILLGVHTYQKYAGRKPDSELTIVGFFTAVSCLWCFCTILAFRAISIFTLDGEGLTRRHLVTGHTVLILWSQISDYTMNSAQLTLFADNKSRISMDRTLHLAFQPEFIKLLFKKLQPYLKLKVAKALQADQLIFKTKGNHKITIEPLRKTICYRNKSYDFQRLQRVTLYRSIDTSSECILTFADGVLYIQPRMDIDLLFGVLRTLAPNAAYVGVSGRIPMDDTEPLPTLTKWQKTKQIPYAYWSNPGVLAMGYFYCALLILPILFSKYLKRGAPINIDALEHKASVFSALTLFFLFRLGMRARHRLIFKVTLLTGAIIGFMFYAISHNLAAHPRKIELPFSLRAETFPRDWIYITLCIVAISIFVAEMGYLLGFFLKLHNRRKSRGNINQE